MISKWRAAWRWVAGHPTPATALASGLEASQSQNLDSLKRFDGGRVTGRPAKTKSTLRAEKRPWRRYKSVAVDWTVLGQPACSRAIPARRATALWLAAAHSKHSMSSVLGAQVGAPEMRRERSRCCVRCGNGQTARARERAHGLHPRPGRRDATWTCDVTLGLGATQVETIDRQSSVAAKPPTPGDHPDGAIEYAPPALCIPVPPAAPPPGRRPKNMKKNPQDRLAGWTTCRASSAMCRSRP